MKFLLTNQSTERLLFRAVDKNDFQAWLEFFKDARAHEHWTTDLRDPEEICSQWYDRQNERYSRDEGGMNELVEKSSGRLIGHAGLLVQSVDDVRELEVAYSLLPEFWGHGYAIEAARKCRDFAFDNKFSPSLISIISVTNISSQKVAVKNGMKNERQTVYKGNAVNIFRVTHHE